MDTEQITIALAERESTNRERLRTLLCSNTDIAIVAECADGAGARDMIANVRPEVVFIDVGILSTMSVVSTASGELPLLVHISADASYALRSFEAGAFDYLIRPISPPRLTITVGRAVERVRHVRDCAVVDALARERHTLSRRHREWQRLTRPTRVALDVGGRVLFLDAAELVWLRENDGVLEVRCHSSVHVVLSTLERMVRRLDPERFIRIQPTLVVNVEAIRDLRLSRISDGTIRLTDGSVLPLSSIGFDALSEHLRR